MTEKKRPEELSFLERLPEGDNPLADCVRFFGSKAALAAALDVGRIDPNTGQRVNQRQVISEWFRRGSIPKAYIEPLHKMTKIPMVRLLKNFEPYRPATGGKEAAVEVVKQAATKPVAVPDVLKKKPLR